MKPVFRRVTTAEDAAGPNPCDSTFAWEHN
jgi:hypothetical protein